MERYDYMEHMVKDIHDWLADNEYSFCIGNYEDWDDLQSDLHDRLWDEDSVTGNGGGYYYCYEQDAERALYGNYSLLLDALEEGNEGKLPRLAVEADVYIRCHLLWDAVSAALAEIADGHDDKTPAEIWNENMEEE